MLMEWCRSLTIPQCSARSTTYSQLVDIKHLLFHESQARPCCCLVPLSSNQELSNVAEQLLVFWQALDEYGCEDFALKMRQLMPEVCLLIERHHHQTPLCLTAHPGQIDATSHSFTSACDSLKDRLSAMHTGQSLLQYR